MRCGVQRNSYSGFVPYLEALQTVCDILYAFYLEPSAHPEHMLSHLKILLYPVGVLYNIRYAVVKGDISALRAHHDEYMRGLHRLLQDPGPCESVQHISDSKFLTEGQAVSLSCALVVFAAAFPKAVNTFDLGAVHVERAITRWKTRKAFWANEDTGADDETYQFKTLWCAGSNDRDFG